METVTIHPAEAYLRNEQNPPSLYVKIEGKRRRLFINRNEKCHRHCRTGKTEKRLYFYELGEYREDILPVPKAGAGSGHGQKTNFEIPETCPACHAYE